MGVDIKWPEWPKFGDSGECYILLQKERLDKMIFDYLKMLTCWVNLPVHLALGDSIHTLHAETYRTGTSGGWLTPEPRNIYQPLHQGVASLSGARCAGRVNLISHLGVSHTARDFLQS